MNLKENLPSRPATAAPGFAGDGITATPRSGFGRAFAWLLLAFALLAPAAQAGAPIGDIVSGGWVNGANFSIGGIGTAIDVNNWPAAESPWQAADGNATTKFLLFKGSNAGLIITPPSSATYNRLALTTANDGPERDPASYKIYGSTTALPTSGNIPISSLTLIQQGTLALTSDRNAGPTIVQFNNTTAYASYVVVFPAVKGGASTTLTQIAEVKLSQGLTVPNQVIVGKAVGGKLVGGSWSNGSIRQSANPEGNNWPAGQSPDHALDGDATTKYLHFQGPNASLGIQPETSPAVINSVSFWTANDEEARDPFGYEVWGNNNGLNPFVGSVPTSSWILLKSGNLRLPPDRNFGPVTVNFPNTTPYAYYAVVFTTVKDSPSVLLTQISEVAFANVPPATLATVTTATQSSVTATSATLGGNVTADGGASVTQRGIVWSLAANPTTANAKVANGSGTGSFRAFSN